MIYRSYACSDCNSMWEVCHESGSDPIPDCPTCSKVLEWAPTKMSIGGSIQSKAVNHAQKMMEEDYGLTNFKDNNREGDVGYISPRKTAAEIDGQNQREAEAYREIIAKDPNLKVAADSFFQPQGGGLATPIAQNMIASAKMGPNAGVNPMELLHKAGREGKLPTGFRQLRAD